MKERFLSPHLRWRRVLVPAIYGVSAILVLAIIFASLAASGVLTRL